MLDSQGSDLPVSHKIGVFDSFENQLVVRDLGKMVYQINQNFAIETVCIFV